MSKIEELKNGFISMPLKVYKGEEEKERQMRILTSGEDESGEPILTTVFLPMIVKKEAISGFWLTPMKEELVVLVMGDVYVIDVDCYDQLHKLLIG